MLLLDDTLKWGASHFFNMHEALKRHNTRSVHQRLQLSQWQSREQVLQYQTDQLSRFLKTVFKEVPFYNKYQSLVSDLHPSPHDLLKKLPLMTKAKMSEHFEALKSQQALPFQVRKTGGSTGEPFKFLLTKRRISHDVAAKRRATRWWGVDIGDTELVIWGSPVEQKNQSLVKEFRDRLLRTQFIGSQNLDEAKAIAILQKIKQSRPRMLFSYPSILNYLAQVARANQMGDLHAKVAFVTSEMLEDFQKHNIEKAFHCKVANGYGGRDLGFVAHACFEGQLHINHEDIIVEILNEQGNSCPPGEVGEIVITHLSTQDFPFIRYRSGDFGRLSTNSCACGRSLPVLDKLEGRVSDLIYAIDGCVIHRNQIIHHLSRFPQIEQFRFEQISLQHSKLLITGDGVKHEHILQLTQVLKQILGESLTLDVIPLKMLPQTASGKHRFIISHLAKPPVPGLKRELHAR